MPVSRKLGAEPRQPDGKCPLPQCLLRQVRAPAAWLSGTGGSLALVRSSWPELSPGFQSLKQRSPYINIVCLYFPLQRKFGFCINFPVFFTSQNYQGSSTEIRILTFHFKKFWLSCSWGTHRDRHPQIEWSEGHMVRDTARIQPATDSNWHSCFW